ncbi:hypothetical protein [Belnapia moabensis]|nr:hypothetical protein [Belnapia moabensis]
MLSAVFGVLGLGAGVVLVLWGVAVRRGMERDGVLHGAGLMPAGAALDVV